MVLNHFKTFSPTHYHIEGFSTEKAKRGPSTERPVENTTVYHTTCYNMSHTHQVRRPSKNRTRYVAVEVLCLNSITSSEGACIFSPLMFRPSLGMSGSITWRTEEYECTEVMVKYYIMLCLYMCTMDMTIHRTKAASTLDRTSQAIVTY